MPFFYLVFFFSHPALAIAQAHTLCSLSLFGPARLPRGGGVGERVAMDTGGIAPLDAKRPCAVGIGNAGTDLDELNEAGLPRVPNPHSVSALPRPRAKFGPRSVLDDTGLLEGKHGKEITAIDGVCVLFGIPQRNTSRHFGAAERRTFAFIDVGRTNMGLAFVSNDWHWSDPVVEHVARVDIALCDARPPVTLIDGEAPCGQLVVPDRSRRAMAVAPRGAPETADLVGAFVRTRLYQFDVCVHIFIERQPPMGMRDIEQLLYVALGGGGRVSFIAPNALHAYFRMGARHGWAWYEDRKSRSEAIAGRYVSANGSEDAKAQWQWLGERRHDVADATLMAIFVHEQKRREWVHLFGPRPDPSPLPPPNPARFVRGNAAAFHVPHPYGPFAAAVNPFDSPVSALCDEVPVRAPSRKRPRVSNLGAGSGASRKRARGGETTQVIVTSRFFPPPPLPTVAPCAGTVCAKDEAKSPRRSWGRRRDHGAGARSMRADDADAHSIGKRSTPGASVEHN